MQQTFAYTTKFEQIGATELRFPNLIKYLQIP